jgi:hypothetical protein
VLLALKSDPFVPGRESTWIARYIPIKTLGLAGRHGIFPSRRWDWPDGTVYSHQDAGIGLEDDVRESMSGFGCLRAVAWN